MGPWIPTAMCLKLFQAQRQGRPGDIEMAEISQDILPGNPKSAIIHCGCCLTVISQLWCQWWICFPNGISWSIAALPTSVAPRILQKKQTLALFQTALEHRIGVARHQTCGRTHPFGVSTLKCQLAGGRIWQLSGPNTNNTFALAKALLSCVENFHPICLRTTKTLLIF